MSDIEYIRDNPILFDKAMKNRGLSEISTKILDLDKKKRQITFNLQNLQGEKKEISREIAKLKSQKLDCEILYNKSQNLSKEIEINNSLSDEITKKLEKIFNNLPNIPDEDVPIGTDEKSNKELYKKGEIKKFPFKPKSHDELGKDLGLMDFKQAAVISGSRFVILKDQLCLLERALINFMLNINTQEFGYTEISPPILVKDSAMYGVGQLPKFEHESFSTSMNLRLIPTGEVPLTNLVSGKILNHKDLPLRFTAFTPCFRQEAGSAGTDTKGIIRQHQFGKVEIVSITKPEKSSEELERMSGIAEEILKKLELPYRKILLSTGDMGFAACKTYDIEVWIPSQNCYREISSCSNCKDFQSRRMKARFKDTDKKNKFVHTLNASALPIGRTIVAIMENYQNQDGTITVPNALKKYININIIKHSQNVLDKNYQILNV